MDSKTRAGENESEPVDVAEEEVFDQKEDTGDTLTFSTSSVLWNDFFTATIYVNAVLHCYGRGETNRAFQFLYLVLLWGALVSVFFRICAVLVVKYGVRIIGAQMTNNEEMRRA